jgi:hypothetical protein
MCPLGRQRINRSLQYYWRDCASAMIVDELYHAKAFAVRAPVVAMYMKKWAGNGQKV